MIIGKLDELIIKKPISVKPKIVIDRLSKLSLLATLAGYNKSQKITLDKEFKTSDVALGDFISFILNHEGFAPIKFNVEVKTKKGTRHQEIKNSEKSSIILASGGIDSTAAILSLLDQGIKPKLVTLDFGQINNKVEQKIIKRIAKKLGLKLIVFKIDIKKEVEEGWKEWSYIVPARNFLIASLGANYLDQVEEKGDIYLAATEEEIKHSKPGPDKSQEFYSFCSRLFSREYGQKMTLKTPFKDITKTELLTLWNKKWLDKFRISPYDTSTCYYGEECGACNSCFKRSLALLSAGLDLDPKIKTNPFKSNEDKTIKYIERIASKDSGFTKKRRTDTLIAFKKAKEKGLLPQKCNELLEKLNNL